MTLKKRSLLAQSFEVIAFTLIICFVGYFIDSRDPLLIHYPFTFLILWLAIVTLFYGLSMGMLMWIVFGLFSLFTYRDDPIFTSFLLENLFFVFLYGLFFYNVHSRIDKLTIRSKYLKLRLKELTNAFFTLKISHDKLESNYISEPFSIRFVIAELLEKTQEESSQTSAENTLKVMEKFFMVKRAAIWQVQNNSLRHCLAAIGGMDHTVDRQDTMIEESLLLRKAIYLKDLKDKEQSNYLYVVPFLDQRDDVAAMLIIQDIPFLFYHEDMLLKINIVFEYIWTKYKKRESISISHADTALSTSTDQSLIDFKMEVTRLSNIVRGFNIDSRIYTIVTRDPYLHQSISDYLYQNETIEILDQYITVQCGNRYIHLILFPFVARSGMVKTAKKLDNQLEDITNRHKIESIEAGLQTYIGRDHFETIISKQISVVHFDQLLEEYGCVAS